MEGIGFTERGKLIREHEKAIEALGWTVEHSEDGWYRASCGNFHTPWMPTLTEVEDRVRLLH